MSNNEEAFFILYSYIGDTLFIGNSMEMVAPLKVGSHLF